MKHAPDRSAERPARVGAASWRWLPVALSVGLHACAVIALVVLAVGGSSQAADPDDASDAFVFSRIEFVDAGGIAADDPFEVEVPSAAPHDPLEFDADSTPVALTPEIEVTLPELDFELPDEQGEPLDLPDVPLSVAKLRRPPEPVAAQPVAAAPRPASTASKPAPVRKAAKLRLLSRPELVRYYPREARRQGIEGEALVEITVDRSGSVVRATVVRSSGSKLLDIQAVRVMYAYRFAAGAGGRARVPVNFQLR